jgi:acetolactate synthase regulatory subunit
MLALFFVRLRAEPGAFERALQPFTVSGFVPRQVLMRKGTSALRLSLSFVGVDADRAAFFTDRLKGMPCVRAVRLQLFNAD